MSDGCLIYDLSHKDWVEVAKNIKMLLLKANFPVCITGAGISVASGLPVNEMNFQGKTVHQLFLKDFWRREPERYFDFYYQVFFEWKKALPNNAHLYLHKKNFKIITQNIDGLHFEAGSKNVIEIHGNLRELRCETCAIILKSDFLKHHGFNCPNCKQILRPGFVFVGEKVKGVSLATHWICQSDLLLIIGTEMDALPIRYFPKIATTKQVPVIWINQNSETIIPYLCK